MAVGLLIGDPAAIFVHKNGGPAEASPLKAKCFCATQHIIQEAVGMSRLIFVQKTDDFSHKFVAGRNCIVLGEVFSVGAKTSRKQIVQALVSILFC